MTDLRATPVALRNSPDLERISKAASYYSNDRFDVVIFSNGTCVFPALKEAPDVSAKQRLEAISDENIGFEVREMDDHNFIVQFSEKIFGIVIRDEYALLRGELVSESRASKTTELLKGRPGAPDAHVYIGLLARTRLLADIVQKRTVTMVSAGSTK